MEHLWCLPLYFIRTLLILAVRILMLIPEDLMRLQLIYFLATVKPVYSRIPWLLQKCPLQPGRCYIEFWILGQKEDKRN